MRLLLLQKFAPTDKPFSKPPVMRKLPENAIKYEHIKCLSGFKLLT
jgi:hypothetical protein